MRVNEFYTIQEIRSFGLKESLTADKKAKVFLNGTKVYFFELVDDQPRYRLYSVINKRFFNSNSFI